MRVLLQESEHLLIEVRGNDEKSELFKVSATDKCAMRVHRVVPSNPTIALDIWTQHQSRNNTTTGITIGAPTA